MIFNTAMYYTEEATIKISVPIPSQKGKLYYTGNEQTPQWDNYDPKTSSISGDTSGTADGTYTAIFTLTNKDMYIWEDGTTDDKYIDWYIGERMYQWISGRVSNSLEWNAVAYGDGKYLCIPNGSNKYTYSSDGGINWNDATLPISVDSPSIIYNNGKFIIVTYSSTKNSSGYYDLKSLYSSDGTSWEESVITQSQSTYPVSNIVYGNNKFVFISNVTSYSSSDGITWTKSLTPSYKALPNIAYGNGLFVAITGRRENYIVFSTNATDWSEANIGWASEGGAVGTRISYGDGKFVIKTDSWSSVEAYIAYSTNGISWTTFRDDVAFGYIDALIYADNKFLDIRHTDYTLGSTGTSYFSDDGLTAWVEVSFPEGISPNCVTYGGNKYVALDSDNYLFAYMGTSNIDVPTQKGTLTYTGSIQSPTWSGYESGKMTMSGDTEGTDAKNYVATFTPKSNYHWMDGTETARNVDWKIDKAIVAVPYQSGTLTYNGSTQSPTWVNYDSSKMTISGDTSGISVGSYTVTFTPNSNYTWADGSTTGKNVTWRINGISPQLTISPASLTLTDSNPTETIIASSVSGGEIYAYENYNGYADISVEGNTITVTAKDSTPTSINYNIIIGVRSTGNYDSATKSCSVSISLASSPVEEIPPMPTNVSRTLSDNTLDVVSAVSANGQAPNYWSVGDIYYIHLTSSTEVLLGSGSINSTATCASNALIILGFDHNKSKESPKGHRIHFQIVYRDTSSVYLTTKPFAITENSCYGEESKDVYDARLIINQLGRVTGWENCLLSNILGSTESPSSATSGTILYNVYDEIKSVMKPVKKWTDNSNTSPASASNVTSTNEYISILSEYELSGKTEYSNPSESQYQMQYDYYKSGNSAITVRYVNKSFPVCECWLRSPAIGHQDYYCGLYTDGTISPILQDTSLGVSPIIFV